MACISCSLGGYLAVAVELASLASCSSAQSSAIVGALYCKAIQFNCHMDLGVSICLRTNDIPLTNPEPSTTSLRCRDKNEKILKCALHESC